MPIKAFVPRYDYQGGYRGWCIKCNTIRIKQKKIKLRKMVSDYKKARVAKIAITMTQELCACTTQIQKIKKWIYQI